jgi:hypothetical protein
MLGAETGRRQIVRRLLLAALLVVTACATRPELTAPVAGPRVVDIHVVQRGWHTDIGLPATGLHPALAKLGRDFPGARHLVFGFGDRGYVLNHGPSGLAALRALWPSPGAILLTALAAPPEAAFGTDNVVTLPLTQTGFDRLQQFVLDSLERTSPGEVSRPIGEGPYPGSVFHASSVDYAATYTCNTWTAEGLAVAGLPIRVSGVLFAHQVMLQARQAATARLTNPPS